MDIKLKGKVILGLMSVLITLVLSVFLLWLDSSSELFNDNYFQSMQFKSQLNQFQDYLSILELNAVTKEEAQKKITVTPEEIKEHRYRYGNLPQQIASIKNQYEQKIQEALITKNQFIADKYITERDNKIKDITNNFKSDEYVKDKIYKEKEQEIDAYFQRLQNLRPEFNRFQGVFKYFLKDINTNKVYSNVQIAGESISKVFNKDEMAYILEYPNPKEGYFTPTRGADGEMIYEETPNQLKKTPSLVGETASLVGRTEGAFEGKIAIPKRALENSFLSTDYNNFKQRQRHYNFLGYVGISSLILGFFVSKMNRKYQESYLEKWRPYCKRIPIDLRVILLLFTCFLSFAFLFLIRDNFFHFDYNMDIDMRSIVIDVAITSLFIGLTIIQGKLLAEYKDLEKLKADWQKSICNRIIVGLKEAFLLRSVGFQLSLLLAVIFVFGAGTFVAFINPFFFILYILFFIFIGLPVIRVIVKSMGYFNNIVLKVEGLANGGFGSELPVVGKSVLSHLAESINKLGQGFDQSQREQAKSERLKTELITNVSHDLRTPLTSIITYAELLKRPDLSEEDRKSYIQVIDSKSQRLKVLIEDLFEVSKMASGNIDLVKEKADIQQLLQQALGEHNEAISESTLDFRINNLDSPVFALVDGQKMWRVFDNLIGNILKYSLENTRVYISVKNLGNKIVITFRNITKFELGENTDELFERFKRGDTSRNTEGSGLGLAIAKSIVDLHRGSLDIEVDGDLFKVTVILKTNN